MPVVKLVSQRTMPWTRFPVTLVPTRFANQANADVLEGELSPANEPEVQYETLSLSPV